MRRLSLMVFLLGAAAVPLAAQPVGPEFRVNSYTTSSQTRPRVAIDSVGSFVVVWQSNGQDGGLSGIFGQRYDVAGAKSGGEFRINAYTTGQQMLPAVASGSAGRFVVVWQSNNQDGDGYGVFGQQFDGSGAPLGAEFRVSAYTLSTQWTPSVASDPSGRFVVAFESYGRDGSGDSVFCRRYDSTGSPIGTEFRVNTYTGSDQRFPAVAADPAGNFVVVWQSGYGQDGALFGVFGQRYAVAGTRLGAEFRVNTYTSSMQTRPSVAVDAAGNFVVVWQGSFQEVFDSTFGVFGQRFGSNGAPLGSEFLVNTYSTNSQAYPSVSSDPAGNFVVTWQSFGQAGPSNHEVIAMLFDSGGAPVGGEFRVNSYTTGFERYPSVATGASGNFIVTWQGDFQDAGSTDGIFAQRYCVDLASVTINVNGSTTICPTGTGGLATVTDSGGGASTHQWGYRTMSGGTITDITMQTATTYTLNGADFPGVGTYFLVCRTTPSCGSMTTSNEVTVTVDATDAMAPVVTPPAAATALQTLCQ